MASGSRSNGLEDGRRSTYRARLPRALGWLRTTRLVLTYQDPARHFEPYPVARAAYAFPAHQSLYTAHPGLPSEALAKEGLRFEALATRDPLPAPGALASRGCGTLLPLVVPYPRCISKNRLTKSLSTLAMRLRTLRSRSSRLRNSCSTAARS